MKPANTSVQIAPSLLRWFRHNKRSLPWRTEPRNPYHVWLSEIMLQQTQVDTVVPYFQRWIKALPTIRDLAQAPLNRVLKLWEGLGYYARARNLHRAGGLVANMGSALPNTVDGLMKLPGIGRYTAGAIASLAFGRRAAVVDGNVRRVLARLHAIPKPNDDALWQLAEAQLPKRNAGQFNEALMELGALVCTPKSPKCAGCPLRAHCRAFALGTPEKFPAPKARKKIPLRINLTLIVVNNNTTLLLRQRPARGLLGGLWEFPNFDIDPKANAKAQRDEMLIRMARELKLGHIHTPVLFGELQHAFTHFKQTRMLYMMRVSAPAKGVKRWFSADEIEQLALTRADAKAFEDFSKTYGFSRPK